MASIVHVLFVADVIGPSGLTLLRARLGALKREHRVDLTIANGENASAGRGLTGPAAQSLFDCGIDVLTSGNHIWNKDKVYPLLDENPWILRPLNYPPGVPGHGSCVCELPDGVHIGVINLQGRSFMVPIDCPFRAADAELERMHREGIRVVVIDMHAEATAEKIALGRHLDGRASAVLGTHTHVQTADERIFPGGTAFCTDVGMTGPVDSVIGMDPGAAMLRFMTQLPVPYRVSESPSSLNAVLLRINAGSGKATSIVRIAE